MDGFILEVHFVTDIFENRSDPTVIVNAMGQEDEVIDQANI